MTRDIRILHPDHNPPPDSAVEEILASVGVRVPVVGDRVLGAAAVALAREVAALRMDIGDLEDALKRAEALADFDALTPLYNRRAFDRELSREIAHAHRHGGPLSLLYVDLDGFKQVNDRFGHATGDDVLVHVAQILKANTRETDVRGRLGGDEFAIALVQCSEADARAKAETLVRLIAATKILDPNDPSQPLLKLGVSMGVAAWQPGMGATELMRRADDDMYAAKPSRRNVFAIPQAG